MSGLLSFINEKFGDNGEVDWPALMSCVEVRRIYGRVRLNKVVGERDLMFVDSGRARVVSNSDKEETTLSLMVRGRLAWGRFADADTDTVFVPEKKVTLSLLRYEKLHQFTSKNPSLMVLYVRLLGVIAIEQSRLKRVFLLPNAADRYEAFLFHFKELADQFQVRAISSFIGVTPESLSRIRADIRR